MKRSLVQVSVATLLSVVVASAANALPPEQKDWEFQGTLYGWASRLDVDVETHGVETEIEKSFFDLLDALGWAVMGGVEGRYKRAFALVDFIGMQLVSDADSGARTFPFQLPGPLATPGDLTVGPADTRTRLTEWMIDTKIGFRVLSLPLTKLTGAPDDPADLRRFDFDLLAGVRVWDIDAKTDLDITPASLTVNGTSVQPPGIVRDIAFRLKGITVPGNLIDGSQRTLHESTSWADPIVGFRVRADVWEGLSLFMLGDIGGWGIGAASDLTWQGMLGARYDWSEHWGVAGGYRALGINRDTGIQGIMYGPQVGVVFRY